MIGTLRFYGILALAGLVLLALLPLQLLGLALARAGWTRLASTVPVLFHRALMLLFDIRLTVEGNLSANRPLLLVSNHLSWLDIIVMSAVAPLSFVAKAEMKSWPLFGWLAVLQRTVFVQREARRNTGAQANEIADRMTMREVMVLFPEGTTTDGNHLAPFKTALFEAAKIALAKSPVETAIVQPAAINYRRIQGLPIGRAERPHVAWPGELGLGESFMPLIREGALDVTVHIGAPIALNERSNRKIVARESISAIRSMLDSSRQQG